MALRFEDCQNSLVLVQNGDVGSYRCTRSNKAEEESAQPISIFLILNSQGQGFSYHLAKRPVFSLFTLGK